MEHVYTQQIHICTNSRHAAVQLHTHAQCCMRKVDVACCLNQKCLKEKHYVKDALSAEELSLHSAQLGRI